ncbi:molybdate transport system ATP-binding protein [Streptoalloteichus tenebrarius]|uniref:Molybdate transport system ATP-binding protein n=1 Tax=Streptoalloteichus tenebrarius (strain ATCC 17920 / DSM 40477 / JCM 4838 / CBS 697.72 / NBRC 16177 / NCIMB 11028 / NRRL B-12390 / A12253. 1 / ISP 5477) TaxID=1933 RepID=A0ABT1HVH1_STRSD|nr:ATP-binding cassette domain-containing protein [Streptoalloteichus tenebrarius]MCP2259513.1 molybdate transport system ATP-binding protein [Streptoalloteichus tenebrarius]BFF01406.1 ATP-binding cassette domain-containing protein [Streptoalloteichus tenebrarius]
MTPRSSALDVDVELGRPGFALSVALRVEPGEVLAVLGPNGSGKSTLLGVLAGLLRPDRGRVVLGGRTLTDAGRGAHVPPHRRGVGLLAQQPLLFPHLTAEANVAFGPRARGVPRRAAREIARRWLSEVDVLELADRRPAELSGGQAQRVAVARALAAEPDLVLLDEPFAALDVDAAPALRAVLGRVLRAGGRTALVVTHDPLDALVLSDRLVVLDAGVVVEAGPTRQVLARPRTAFTARIAGLELVAGVAAPTGLRAPDGAVLAGHREPGLVDGVPAVAVFPPRAVAVHRERPNGSPRNVFPVVLAGLEPRADVVRLRAAAAPGGPGWAEGLSADVTPAAVADLGLEPGLPVWFAVKATEVTLCPAPGETVSAR